MNIFIYGSSEDKEDIIRHIEEKTHLAFRVLNFHQTSDQHIFSEALQNRSYELIFVTQDGAAGMEGVITAQNTQPHTPIIWFSNDKDFGVQSYRLGVNFLR